jgi:hypothetical protein
VGDGTEPDTIALARDKLKLDASAMALVELQAREVLERVDEVLEHKRADLPDDERSEGPPVEKKAAPVSAPQAKAPMPASARKSPVGLLSRLWRALSGR